MEEITIAALQNPIAAGPVLFGAVWIIKQAANLKGWIVTFVALALSCFVAWGMWDWSSKPRWVLNVICIIFVFGAATGIDRGKDAVKSLVTSSADIR